MEYISVVDELRRLEHLGQWDKVVQMSEMSEIFSDLRLFKDHWGVIRYCSKEANQEVEMMEVDYCHVCSTNPIEVWFYIELDPDGLRLYSDPPVVTIADQNSKGFGWIPRIDWEENLKEDGFDRFVIAEIRDQVRANPPINYIEDSNGEGSGGQGTSV